MNRMTTALGNIQIVTANPGHVAVAATAASAAVCRDTSSCRSNGGGCSSSSGHSGIDGDTGSWGGASTWIAGLCFECSLHGTCSNTYYSISINWWWGLGSSFPPSTSPIRGATPIPGASAVRAGRIRLRSGDGTEVVRPISPNPLRPEHVTRSWLEEYNLGALRLQGIAYCILPEQYLANSYPLN